MKLQAACLVLLAGLAAPRAEAGLLSAGSVAVLDGTFSPRTSFTNNEVVTFQQRVFNGVASAGRVTFTFTVLGPSGGQVFQITGNSAPGSVGNASTQLSGFPISKFYAGPGVYTLRAQAALDAQVITQQATFVVSSPNVLLLYPPNGAQNIADVPLTFRWVSSGGTTYKVTVGNNPSFYNALFSQSTAGGETSLSYPVNPSDPRLILAAGQTYYWKVQAYSAAGLEIGASASPYSFTVQTAALSRDMAVTELAIQGGPDALGNLPFKVTVSNQGGTAQTNIPLRFGVGGLAAPGTPVSMSILGAGESRDFFFSAPVPTGQSQSLAIACIDFSDDNIANNCKTLMINQASQAAAGAEAGGGVSSDQLWQNILDLLRQQGMDLSEFNMVGMEGQLSNAELQSLLASLKTGEAGVSLSGPALQSSTFTPPASAPAPAAPPPPSAPPDLAGPAGLTPNIDEFAPLGTEWSGFSPPLTPKPLGGTYSDAKAWKRIWRQISTDRVPKIDFTQHMVVGVFAAKGEARDHAEIKAVEMSLSGLVVRYEFVAYATFNVNKAPRSTVPYRLRVVPRTSVPVQFVLISEKEDAPSSRTPQEKK
jgi:hypothetical protein